MKLTELVKQEHFASLAQETVLNIIATSSWIMTEFSSSMAPFGITPAQYNVLRIVNGVYPESITCSSIGERLIERTPDVSRLLDRLSKSGLIHRQRDEEDRRIVNVSITERGLDLLDRMKNIVDTLENKFVGHLTVNEQREVVNLLERMRIEQQV